MPMRVVRKAIQHRWPIITAAIVAGAIGFSIDRAFGPDPWDPLGDYPIQVITDRVPGITGPAVRLGDPVHSVGRKCNDTDSPVLVSGTRQWQSQRPGGFIAGIERGNAPRIPGCEKREFWDVPPPDVVAQMQAAISNTRGPVVWALNGSETPTGIVENGQVHAMSNGVPREWTTENFTVVPQDWRKPGQPKGKK